MTPMKPTVFVVDDQPEVHAHAAAIAASLGLRCETFCGAEQFLAAADPSRSGCVVAELHLDDMDGVHLQQRLDKAGSTWPVVFVCNNVDLPAAVRVMRNGATAVFEKPFDGEELANAILAAVDLDRATRETRYRHAAFEARLTRLDRREREVMAMVVNGLPNKTIARELRVCQRTAAEIRARVFQKMEAESATSLAMMLGEFGRRSHDGMRGYANIRRGPRGRQYAR